LLADWKFQPNFLSGNQQFTIYARVGFSDHDVSRFKRYAGGGITFRGLLPGDSNGLVGFSIASVQNSNVFNKINPMFNDYGTVY